MTNLTAKIFFTDADGRDTVRILNALQSMIIGSSMAADIQLYNEANVQEKHCLVSLTSEGCFLRDLTGGKGVTKLNGVVITDNLLNEKNQVEIGNNEILIEVFGLDELRQGQEAPAENSASIDPPKFVIPAIHTLENGLKIFELPDNDGVQGVFSERIFGNRNLFLLENHKSCGLESPDPRDDLLADFPEEVRSDNSLTLTGPRPFEEFSNTLFDNRARDYSILVAPKKADATLDEIRLTLRTVVAWFIKPSNFDFHMRKGTKLLLEKTVAEVDFVTYFLPLERTWIVATVASRIGSFGDLGLPNKTEQSAT